MNKPSTPPRNDPDFEKRVRDLDHQLELLRKLAANRSPYFAWEAIGTCIRKKKQFPDWINNYLAQCADRMQSKQAKRAGDARKALQWIFDFPKTKAGPGGLFDQDRGLLKEVAKSIFALNFAMRLYQGEDPVQARCNAGDEVFGLINSNTIDDRTLQRILLEQFQLKNLPLTADGWAPLIDPKHLTALAEKLLFSLGGK